MKHEQKKELIKGYPSNLEPRKLDKYFETGEEFSGNLADLLLNNEATAIYHLSQKSVIKIPRISTTFLIPLLLGVNYTWAHSEGRYKIVVQNIPERKGPWVLFNPPNANEDTFYLQDVAFPGIKPEFEDGVINFGKIKQFYSFRGDSLKVFTDFKEKGFKFVDEAMPIDHYRHLLNLSRKAFYK